MHFYSIKLQWTFGSNKFHSLFLQTIQNLFQFSSLLLLLLFLSLPFLFSLLFFLLRLCFIFFVNVFLDSCDCYFAFMNIRIDRQQKFIEFFRNLKKSFTKMKKLATAREIQMQTLSSIGLLVVIKFSKSSRQVNGFQCNLCNKK